MIFGNMANDGGNLIIEDEDLEKFLNDEPESKKYIKQLIGSEEFINNKKRWCLWLVGIDPSDLRTMPKVLERVEKTKQHRLNSNREATKKLAKIPYLFGEIRQPENNYLLIPRVSSENREIIPIGYFSKDVNNDRSLCLCSKRRLYLFGVLTSSLHMVWVNKVCGRLKSDYNYSINIVYQ